MFNSGEYFMRKDQERKPEEPADVELVKQDEEMREWLKKHPVSVGKKKKHIDAPKQDKNVGSFKAERNIRFGRILHEPRRLEAGAAEG